MGQYTTVGNLTDDPELRVTPNGKTLANFTIAENSRRQVNGEWQDEGVLFIRCTAFDSMAQNIVQSLSKGMSVMVEGTLKNRQWEDREGNKRDSIELTVRNCGPSLKRQIAQVRKADPQGQQQNQGGFNNGGGFGGQQQGGFDNDPWNSAPPTGGFGGGGFDMDEEAPF